MISEHPFNVWLLNPTQFIEEFHCLPVTSHQIFESSSTQFQPNGLFSEEIFGEIGSDMRLIKFGYIELNTKVFHPHIFNTLISMRGLYKEIMSGKTYAYFSDELKDFVVCGRNDPDAGTGYQFFMEYFEQLNFKETNSSKRSIKIDIFNKYKDNLYIDKYLIIPATLRDIEDTDTTHPKSDEINDLYQSLLSLSLAMPKGMGSHPIFNSVRWNIQTKGLEIYEYIKNLLDGKRGFAQGKYMARKLALGTRNVISSSMLEGESPFDPRYQKFDETMVPLFQAIKMYEPVIQYYLKTFFYGKIFDNSNKVAAIHPKSLSLDYISISDIERNRYTTDDGIGLIIDQFIDENRRFKPVTIYDIDKKPYYLALVLDKEDKIYVIRSAEEFIESYNTKYPDSKISYRDLRPLTLIELMYITAYPALTDTHMLNTRYPVIHIESIYPSKIHLCTTHPSRVVQFCNFIDNGLDESVMLPEYPVLQASHMDSMIVHPCWLANLGGDYDGDMGNGTGVITKNANDEISEYMNSPISMIDTNGNLTISISKSTLVPYVLYNMSRDRIKKAIDLEQFHPSLNRVKYSKLFKEIMPVHQCVIIGSSFLAALGLTENNDIDCVCSDYIWDIIGSSGRFSYNINKDEFHTENNEISVFHSFYEDWDFSTMIQEAIEIGGLLFAHPKVLYEYAKKRNLPKDKVRIALYEKYLSNLIK